MKIYLTYDVYQRYLAYMRLANGEISGLGRSHLDENYNVVVTDLWLWEQECSGATTEVVDHDSVFKLVADLVGQGIPMEELNVWWHSHVDMGAFFSGVDRQTIEEWVNNRFLVAIVGNRKGEFEATVAIKAPIPCDLSADVAILYPEIAPAVLETIQEEIAQKVKTTTWKDKPVKGFQDRKGKKEKETEEFDWTTHEVEMAGDCGCDECVSFLNGKRERFPYATHHYVNGVWVQEEAVAPAYNLLDD